MVQRCLYGSEMVVSEVVTGKCEIPITNISQENGQGIFILKCQFTA